MDAVASKYPVAICGATGIVGQTVLSLLKKHPHLELQTLCSSKENVGKTLGAVLETKGGCGSGLEAFYERVIEPIEAIRSKYVISCLPAPVAFEAEKKLAEKGHYVFSNASSHRMDPAVPIIIPEINLNHLELLKKQKTPGCIVTNPNCVAVIVALALFPLQGLGNLKCVHVTTLQAISGAGLNGLQALDIVDNILPNIPNEAEKIERETKKILEASFAITAQTNRVPIRHGHTAIIHASFEHTVSVNSVLERFSNYSQIQPKAYKLHTHPNRPQVKLDLEPQDERIHIGAIRQGENPNCISFSALAHNLFRGAASAVLANLNTYLSWSQSS